LSPGTSHDRQLKNEPALSHGLDGKTMANHQKMDSETEERTETSMPPTHHQCHPFPDANRLPMVIFAEVFSQEQYCFLGQFTRCFGIGEMPKITKETPNQAKQ